MRLEFSKPERLPSAAEIEGFLVRLLEIEVAVKTVSRNAFKIPDTCALGLYRKHDRHAGAVVIGDRHFTHYVGAAVAKMSRDEVRPLVKSPSIDEAILGRIGEVFSALTRILNTRGTPELTFHGAREEALPLTGPLGELVEEAPNRIDLEASVDGYGKGRMALVLF